MVVTSVYSKVCLLFAVVLCIAIADKIHLMVLVLNSKLMQMTKVVLVQAKADHLTCLDDQELEFLLGLGGIKKQWGDQLKIVKASSTIHGGYDELIDVLKSVKCAENTL